MKDSGMSQEEQMLREQAVKIPGAASMRVLLYLYIFLCFLFVCVIVCCGVCAWIVCTRTRKAEQNLGEFLLYFRICV